MKKYFYYSAVFILIIVLNSCNLSSGKKEVRKVKGDRYAGGTFHLSEQEYYTSLYPPHILDVVSYRVAAQIFEGLVKFKQDDLTVIPAIAEKWTINDSGTTYTFFLRKNVRFHDDDCFKSGKGREVTAQDFVYCFKKMATKSENNTAFEFFMKNNIAGADKYFESTSKGELNDNIEGIKAIDNYTLEITLIKPNATFLQLLAYIYASVYPKEAYEKYQEKLTVGTGPFKYSKAEEKKLLVLEKNMHYYKQDDFGNQLPLLDTLKISFINDRAQMSKLFKNRMLDMAYQMSTDVIISLLEIKYDSEKGEVHKIIQQRTAELSTHYISMLNIGSVFENKDVRKAFNLAIDRKVMIEKILDGEGQPANHGVTPPVITNFDISQVKGYTIDIPEAKKLMAKAGYPNGVNFPKLELNITKGGGRNVLVAEEIKSQLKANLNIDIEINIVTLKEKIELAKKGKSPFTMAAWIGDYPSPATFLSILYGKNASSDLSKESFPNYSRYVNEKFDETLEKGLSATSLEESYKYFIEAEKIALEDAPLLLLFYDENYRLLQPYVKNFPNNAMQYRDFSEVWVENIDLQLKSDPAEAN